MREKTAEDYRRRGIGLPQGPVRRPALVVVDLTYGFTGAEGPLGCAADEAVADTARPKPYSARSGRARARSPEPPGHERQHMDKKR